MTKQPNVIPKKYKLKKSNNKGGPIVKKETPNNGVINIIAGTIPTNVLSKAVVVSAVMISLILMVLQKICKISTPNFF